MSLKKKKEMPTDSANAPSEVATPEDAKAPSDGVTAENAKSPSDFVTTEDAKVPSEVAIIEDSKAPEVATAEEDKAPEAASGIATSSLSNALGMDACCSASISQVDDTTANPMPPLSSSKKKKEPFVHDPNQFAIKFIFAGRDGVDVVCKMDPSTSVTEVKAMLLSLWPDEIPPCSGQDRIRLVCMGKGMLSPDNITLSEYGFPTFLTHPTPVNVSVRPETFPAKSSGGASQNVKNRSGSSNLSDGGVSTNGAADARCGCVIS
mmetsp:Transcript_42651/g.100024  ORF Transcript_42651/g.100024 Transcript_42651/m.100024 type:complete len:263 (+) Transcript_42651:1820-2608(+)